MAYNFSYIPYKETGFFSKLVEDYISDDKYIKPFIGFEPNKEGIEKSLNARYDKPVNRKVLVDTLKRQYGHLVISNEVEQNLELLADENTFTICTAHQPNLMTGYLYFIYKILHAIKMASELKAIYPDKNFVPVYYMGSEDNDIEELGVFSFRGEKYVWDGAGQGGAVGRMQVKGMEAIIDKLLKNFGPPGADCERLRKNITEAYNITNSIADATQYLVNELFGNFGLIILNPDDAAFKELYIPVMRDELLAQHSFNIINDQIALLAGKYKIQAAPREINLFYLNDNLRERIEKTGDVWKVLNTEIEWNETALMNELQQHPERFSPNVMLRGMYQETILPNIVFIGGGAEVAYWLQLKTLFDYYNVHFPVIFLRQSVMWMDKESARLQTLLDLQTTDIFNSSEEIAKKIVSSQSDSWKISKEAEQIEDILNIVAQKAELVDYTLKAASGASLTKIRRHLHVLEQKMYRAEKRKFEVETGRINKLKSKLFPGNSLQERSDNFMEYYLDKGDEFLNIIYEGILPFDNKFLVLSEKGLWVTYSQKIKVTR